MQRQIHNKLSKSINQDYILSQFQEPFSYSTIYSQQQCPKKNNISPIFKKQVKQGRQIPVNLDIYNEYLTSANSQGNSKINGDIYQSIFIDSDEHKQNEKIDQHYYPQKKINYKSKTKVSSNLRPSTILSKNKNYKFDFTDENHYYSTSRSPQKRQNLSLNLSIQVKSDRYRYKLFKNKGKTSFLSKFQILSKVIGRLIILYFRFALKLNLDQYTQKAKIDKFCSFKSAFKIVRNFSKDYQEKVEEWTTSIFKKIFYYMEKKIVSIINDELMDEERIQDQNRLWCLNFANFLFQNIELITRKGNIPREIIEEISRTTLTTKNTYRSLFVARRVKFLSLQLSKSEYQLITSEFLFFNIIMSQLFFQANQLKYQSLKHNLHQKMQIIELASIIQSYFLKYFVNMPQREDISEQMLYQRKLYITSNKQQELMLLDTKDVHLSEAIVIGLKSEEYVNSLFKNKELYSKRLGKLFDKTIQNIYSQIEICEIIQ